MAAPMSERLKHALLSVAANSPRIIGSHPSIPHVKRASVALIIRVKPSISTPSQSRSASPEAYSPSTTIQPTYADVASTSTDRAALAAPDQIRQFFDQQWVKSGAPEILYIKRASRASDRWSAHIAFPGGRQDPDDENSHFTALRETYEEVGIDLAEKDYIPIGRLDDREITSSLGKKLLMILSPFVFLHTGPDRPPTELQVSEVASAHFIPLSSLHVPDVRWGDVSIDLGTRLAPKNAVIRSALKLLIGHMKFRCILLPNEPIAEVPLNLAESYHEELPDLRLWGLTLGMTLDLLALMSQRPASDASLPAVLPSSPATYPMIAQTPKRPGRARTGSSIFGTDVPPSTQHLAPSMASMLPKFDGPDVNFWLFVFSWRYRRLVRKWDNRVTVAPSERRVNWAGLAINEFYACLRRALLVTIIFRASVVLGAAGTIAAWIVRQIRDKRRAIRAV